MGTERGRRWAAYGTTEKTTFRHSCDAARHVRKKAFSLIFVIPNIIGRRVMHPGLCLVSMVGSRRLGLIYFSRELSCCQLLHTNMSDRCPSACCALVT